MQKYLRTFTESSKTVIKANDNVNISFCILLLHAHPSFLKFFIISIDTVDDLNKSSSSGSLETVCLLMFSSDVTHYSFTEALV